MLLSRDELVERLCKALQGMDGISLADLWNREFGSGMVSLDDDTFEEITYTVSIAGSGDEIATGFDSEQSAYDWLNKQFPDDISGYVVEKS